MKNLYQFLIPVVLFSVCACGSKVDTSSADEPESDQAVSASVEEPAVCIWKEVGIRSTPQEKGKYVTTMYLGEKATALGDTASELVGNRRYQYVRVRLIDQTEGWIRSDFIAVGATPAALLKETTIYKRPDLMTSTEKTFAQMDFVAIRESLEGWVEVIGKRKDDSWFSSGWIKGENVTTQPTDVAFSVFYTKAMMIEDPEKQREEISKLLKNTDLASSTFYPIVTSQYSGDDEYEEYDEEEYVEG